MKKIVSLLLSVLMIVGIAIPVYAEDDPAVIASGTVKGSVTWKVTEDGVLTIGGTGPMENYTAALKISSLHYTKAPYYEYKDQITSLVIEEGVTSIGYKAFFEWSNLTGSLSIPASVTTISAYAFKGCNGFTGDLTIPDTVSTLGENAFYTCKGFNGTLNIGSGISTIPKMAFYSCSGLTGILNIPDNIQKINESAFQSCSGFSGDLVIPDSVTEIGDSAFRSCTGFHGTLSIGTGVSTIGGSAFYGCSGFIGSLTIGTNVTSIGSSAFRGCSGFTGDLVIPDSIQSVGPYTFYDCSGFDGSLQLGSSVNTINSNAFAHCNNLSGTLVLPDSLTHIGEYAFYRCVGFSGSLSIPDSVVSIGAYAFNDCPGFNGTLTIGNSVESIGDYAFGDYAKDYRNHFTGSLVIPDSVKSIGGYAFIDNDFNGTLTLGQSVETIGNYAFANYFGGAITTPPQPTMKFIGDLRIPDSVKSIGIGAFQCNTFNGILYLGNSLETIGNAAFAGCTSLTGTLHIPDSVTEIGEDAFHAAASCAKVTVDSRIKYGALNEFTFTGSPEDTNIVQFFAEHPEYITIVEESRTEPTPDALGQVTYRVYCNDAVHNGAQTDSNVNFTPQTLVARINEAVPYDGEILIRSMTVTPGTIHFEDFGSQQLGVIINPDNATNKTVTYTSSDESVAVVSEGGLITAVGPGSAVITVSATDGSGVSKTVQVTVDAPDVPVSSITLDADSMLIGKGRSSQIGVSVAPEDATNKTLTYSSSDASVATVNANGIVSGVSVGTAVITVAAADGSNQQAALTVQVYDIEAKADMGLKVGETADMSVSVLPAGTDIGTVTYTSSDVSVATVDGNGTVTAIGAGTAVITATNGTVTKTSTVTVADLAVSAETVLSAGSASDISVTVYPEGISPKSVNILSSDPSVVRIEDCKIIGVGEGSATVTVEVTVEIGGEDLILTKELTVSCFVSLTGFDTNFADTETMYVGQAKELTVTPVPADCSAGAYTVSVEDSNVVTYLNGVIIACSVGNTTVTISSDEDPSVTETLSITVYDIAVPEDKAVEVGRTVDVSATVIPEGAADVSFAYTSTDEYVATVDESGHVTALNYGTTVISVTDGNITKGVAVTVVDADATVTNDHLKKGETSDIQVTVYPASQEIPTVVLTSSDESVAKIENGKIVGIGNGSAEITAEITIEVDGKEVTLIRTVTVSSEIPVTGLTVNNMTDPDIMYLSEEKTLDITVTPVDAANTDLSFTSSDPSVISVDENGQLIANAAGTAEITVAATDGSGIEQTLTVTVYDITVPGRLTVEAGKTVDADAKVIPDSVANVSLTYSSTDEEVAAVDADGHITALKYGTTAVSVTDGHITRGIAITVVDADATVTNTHLKKDETADIRIEVYPDGYDTVSVTLTSSDESVAKIDDGKIVGVGNGTAEITAEITIEVNGEEITLIRTVTVSSEIPVTGLTVNNLTDPDTMYLGEEKTLDVTVIPSDAANTDLTFTSSDPSVISIDENGRLIAIAVGTSVITVEAADGSGTVQTLTVTVYDITVPAGLTVEAGKTAAICAQIIPDGATEASFVYSSSDERIAAVDTNGILAALEYGTAVVSVTDGNITKDIAVTVVDADATVTNSNLKKDETAEILVTVHPDGADTVSVTLTSSDDSVVTIKDGKIVGVSNGTAEITAEITVEVDGEEITLIRTFTVTSEIPVAGIAITNLTDPTIMYVGEEKNIEVTVIPEDAANKILNYSSSDPSVVSVDENGRLTANAVGSAVITVMAADDSGTETSLTVIVYSHTAQKDATPEEDGNKEYYSDADGNKFVREDDGSYIPVSDEDIILHYPGETVCENISKEPTCVEEGICEYVVYCVNCGKELSRTTGTIPPTGIHTPGEPVHENISAEPTCVNPGYCDTVTYCTVCGQELSRTGGEIPPTGIHRSDVGTVENVVEPDCTHEGHYDIVTRCLDCGAELARETYQTDALGHTPGEPEISDVIAPTCTQQGSHTETVICTACGETLSIRSVNDGYGDHVWNDGEVKSGEYDRYTVTDYTCTECGAHRTERTLNPNYQFRCKRCDWYEANKDATGVYKIVVVLVHAITHMVQQINYWT